MVELSPPTDPNITPSRWGRFLLWFAANRLKIGGAIGTLAIVVRAVLTFQGHTEVADFLKSLADLIIAGSAYTVGAALHKSDPYWQQKREEVTIPPSQQLMSPYYNKRKTDS